jgi:membrane-bound lytic murein transglycosylase D
MEELRMTDRQGRFPFCAAFFMALLLGSFSCKTSNPQKPLVKVPVDQGLISLPSIELSALPSPPVRLLNDKALPTILADPVEQVIQRSQEKFLQGEENFKSGFLEKAKKDFDEALEIVLRAGFPISGDERLERHYEGLIDRIFNYELAALKEGDGFTEERYETAPIDEIATAEIPSTVAPESRQLAEESLKKIPHDLPIVANDTVLRYVNYYQNRGRKAMEAGMQRLGRYREMISKILAEEGVPQDLIYLCQLESGFKPLALSRAKCKGLWQFAVSRGREYGLEQNWWVDERSDPEKSTRAAASHLKDLYLQFGDWLLAMAAYNTGPGNVERAIERTGYADYWELSKRGTLHPDTVSYVPVVMAISLISKDPSKYGFEVTPDPPIHTDKVNINSAIDLRLVAESLDLSLSEIRELNPHVRRLTTPRKDPDFTLYLPAGTKGRFQEEIAVIPEEMRVTWRKHRVEEGESLSSIAKKYRTTSSAIAQANSLDIDQKIQVGDKLIIPVTARRASGISAEKRGIPIRYTVQKGDTIARIAKDLDVSVQQIRRWNRIRSRTPLKPGRILLIYPDSKSAARSIAPVTLREDGSSSNTAATQGKAMKVIHRVKKGDTLYTLAANYKTTVEMIRDWNNLSEDSTLRVGERLTIYLDR